MSGNASIVDADISATAEIAVSKLADGAARQLLQTDAAGTGVEWASNIDIPGTLDVTGAATFDAAVSVALGSAASPSLTFTGDTNTGIYSPGADQVAISTGGSGRLFVDSSGRVSVGTSAPAARLQVNQNTDSATALAVVSTSANTGITSDYASLYLQNTNTTDNNYNTIGFINDQGGYSAGIHGIYTSHTSGSQSGAIAFATSNAGSYSEKLRITSAGLVGVGTSDPTSGTSSYYDDLVVRNATSGTGAGITIQSNSTNGFSGLNLRKADGTDLGKLVTDSSDGKLYIETAGVAAITVDTSQRVGIGATPLSKFHVNLATNENIQFSGGSGDTRIGSYNDAFNTTVQLSIQGSPLLFRGAGGTEVGRWDSSGRLLIGTSSSPSAGLGQYALAVVQGYAGSTTGEGILSIARGKVATSMVNTDTVGQIAFTDNAGNTFAKIVSFVDGTVSSTSDLPGGLTFSTTADGASSPTERMRITSGGALRFGQTTTDYPGSGNTTTGIALTAGGRSGFSQDGDFALLVNRNTSDGTIVQINRQGSGVGSISVTTTATAYNTSSDYRLKENVTAVTDGITRLQQLKPSRFNFIADPDKTVDGFLAHEVQTIVPEAIIGEKDAVDADGKPIYQGIDQSKLVPLLTAALQEAVARIETLEAKVAALESA